MRRRAVGRFWAGVLAVLVLGAGLGLVAGSQASAQTYTASLTLDPTEIAAADLNGATITLEPEHATFILAGGGDGGGGQNSSQYIVEVSSDFEGVGENRKLLATATPAFNAAGLAEISLSGAPAGLTIASGRLLAVENKDRRGLTDVSHRSAEITLAYSGSAADITADAAVTVTVTKKLLRKGGAGSDGNGPIDEATVSAQFTAKAADDGLPTVEVPADWALVPAGVSAGESFRLLFVTSAKRNAEPTDIADYNGFVQTRAAAASDQTIMDNSAHFRVLGSTAAVAARNNTETNVNDDGAGEKIFWLGGAQVADDYADLYDGNWDSNGYRNENGVTVNHTLNVFTGTNDNGTSASAQYLGAAFPYGTRTPATNGLHCCGFGRLTSHHFFALSPVFQVAAASGTLPEVSIAGPAANVAEGSSAVFTVSSDTLAPAGGLTVKLTVADAAAPRDFVHSDREVAGSQEVVIPAGATSATYDLPIQDDDVLEEAGDVTVSIGASASDYNIESGKGSATASVALNDTKTVGFSASAYRVQEGEAVTLTVQLDSGTTSKPLTIQLGMINGTANRFTDLSTTIVNVTIPANGSRASGTVPTVADGVTEGDETFEATIVPVRLTLDYPNGDVTLGSPARALVTICEGEGCAVVEDPGPPADPVVHLAPDGAVSFIPENGGTGSFAVWLNATVAAGDSVTVPLAFSVPPADPANPQPHETPGSAERGTDYTLKCSQPTGVTCALTGSNPTITFGPGSGWTPVRVTLTGVGSDNQKEGTETVIVSLGAVSGWAVSGGAIFFLTEEGVTLTPDTSDGGAWSRPGFDYELRLIEGHADDNAATYEIVLDNNPRKTVTIDIASDDPSVTISPSSLKFKPTGSDKWSRPRTVTVTAADDADGAAGAATITHTATAAGKDGPYHRISISDVTVNVLDDDATPAVSITGGDDVTEGTAAEFTLTAYPPPTSAITVAYSVFQIGDFVSSGNLASGTITLNAGQGSVMLPVPTLADATKENDGTLLVSLIPPAPSAGYAITPPTVGQVTVLDDDGDPDPPTDPPVVLSIVAGSDAIEGTPGEFVVTVTGDSGEYPVRYTPEHPGGSRAMTSNYGPRKAGLREQPHWTSYYVVGQRTVTLTASTDSRDEPSELVYLEVNSNKSAHRSVVPPARDGLLTLDDDPTTVALARTGSGDIMENGETATLTITLGRALKTQITRRSVHLPEILAVPLTLGGDATAGVDYTLTCAAAQGVTCSGLDTANPVVTFTGSDTPSATVATLTLTAVDDIRNEGSGEDVSVTLPALLSDPSDPANRATNSGVNLHGGATGSGGPFSLTITDDDTGTAPDISIAAQKASITEGANAVFILTADPVPTADITVDVLIAETGGPHVHPSGQLKTHSVTITGGASTANLRIKTQNDEVQETNGTITATVQTGTTYTVSDTEGAATVAVKDNDAPVPEVSVSASKASITEGESAVFTVTANPTPAADIKVNVRIEAVKGDFIRPRNQITTHSVTIAGGAGTGTLTITTQDDDKDEENGIIRATLSTPGAGAGYTLGSSSTVSVAVQDNDDPVVLPEISVTVDKETVTERNPSNSKHRLRFTVSSNVAPSANLKVQLTLADVAGSDFITGEGTKEVTIRKTKTSATLDVRVNNDNVNEDSGYVTLTVKPSDSNKYTVGDPSVASVAVIDDDGGTGLGPQVSIAAAESSITEGESAVFTLTVDPAPTADITVNVDIAETGGPHVHPSGQIKTHTVTISGGATTGTLTITTQDDSVDEDDGTIEATVQTGTGYTPASGSDSVEVNVLDDDAVVTLPEVEIEGPAGNTPEGANATFTVRVDTAPTDAAGLTVLLHVDDADSPRDFVVAGQEGDKMVTIPQNMTSATYDVPITQDNVLELAGTVTVMVRANASAYTIKSGEGSATASVARNDAVTVKFNLATYTVAEGATVSGTVEFTSGTASMPVAVQVLRRLNTGDSAEAADFTSSPVTVTIPAGMSSVAFTAPTTPDTFYEGNEVFTLAIAPAQLPAGVTRGTPNVAKVTITDNDTPVISIAAGTSPVTEAAGANASFTIKSNIGIETPLNVSVNVTETGAFVASTNEGAKTATFATDTTAPFEYVYNVPIVNDTTNEANGNVTVAVQTGTGYTRHATATMRTATVAVQDDDLPVVSINGPSGTVAEGANATFTVSVERVQSANLVVLLHVDDAASPRDFVIAGQEGDKMVTIMAGDMSATYNVPITQDTVLEDAGNVGVNIRTSASAYRIKSGMGTATASVAQNDTKTVQFSANTYQVTEAGSAFATLTVQLNSGTTSKAIPVTVNLTDVSAVRSSDYTGAATRTVTIPAGGSSNTLQILAVDDSIDEPNQTFTAQIQSSGLVSGVTRGTTHTATVTIVDNDVPVVSVTAVAASVTEAPGNPNATFRVSSTLASEHEVTVKLTIADVAGSNFLATGAEGTKDVVIPTSATGPITKDHSVAIQNDAVDEAGGNITGTLAAGTGYTIASAPGDAASVMVNDDDVPQIRIAADAASVTEGAGAAVSFTLTSTLRSMQAIQVNVTIAEAAGSAYINNTNEGNKMLTLAASPTAVATHTFTVPLVNDNVDELDGSVAATLTAPPPAGRYTIATSPNNAATVALVDDDVPEVTIMAGTSPVTEGTAASFTLNISPAPVAALTVNYTLADAPSADFVAEGAKTVNVNADATSRNISIATKGGLSETTDEPSGPVKVTLAAGSNYTIGSANTAMVTVQDNDPTIVELDVSGGTPPPLTEGGTRAVTLRLPRALYAGETLTVPITNFTTAGHATRGGATADYNLTCPSPLPTGFACNSINTTSGSVAINGSAGGSATELVMTLTGVSDGVNEAGGENINLGLGIMTHTGLHGGLGSLDNAPTFKLNDPPANPINLSVTGGGLTVAEGGSSRMIRATLGSPNTSGSAISIPIVVGAGSTAQGVDYTLGAMSISIANNASSGTTSFTINNDSDDEPDEQVIVELGSPLPSGFGQGPSNSVTLTIQDKDPTPVTLARTPAGTDSDPIDEAAGAATLTVTLGRPLASGESLPVTLTLGGTAMVDTDYEVTCANATGVNCADLDTTTLDITFSSGGQTATLTITATQDTEDEGASESISVTMGALTSSSGTNLDGGATGSGGPITFNITDDDDPVVPVVTITRLGSATVTEGAAVQFRLSVTPAPAANISVSVTVADAPAPSDFLQPGQQGNRTIPVNAGAATKDFTVQTHPDSADEPHGDVRVTVNAGGSAYNLGAVATRSATVTVNDDDGPPPVEITISRLGAATIIEGAQARFRLTSSPAPTTDITVNVTVADASAPSDFLQAGQQGPRTITISSGATTQDFTVQTHPDSADEPNGDIRATVTTGTGYTLGSPSTVTTRVNDNDLPPRPTVTITGGDSVTEGTAAQFTVTSSFAPTSNLTVNVTVSEVGGGEYVSASQERSRDIVIAANTTSKNFTVPTQPDSVEEPAGRVRATVNARTAYTLGSPRVATVDIWDDDAPTLVTISAGVGDDGLAGDDPVIEGGSTAFTLHVSPPSSSALTVNVTIADAGNGSVLTGANTGNRPVTVPPNMAKHTFSVPTENDYSVEPHGLVRATVAAGNGYQPGTPVSASVPVWNNDRGDTPQLLVSPKDVTVTERGYPAQYLVGLNTEPDGDVTVRLYPQGNTDSVTVEPQTLTFTQDDWNKPQAVTVTAPPDDNTFNERITVWHTVWGYGRVNRGPSATINVTDDGRGPRPRAWFFHASSTALEAVGIQFALIQVSPAPTRDLTLRYRLSGDAILGDDYTIDGASGNEGTITVPRGQGRALLPIMVADDDEHERVEIVTLTFQATGDDEYTVLDRHKSHTVAILSDDPPPTRPRASFHIVQSTAAENKGTHTVRVNLSPAPSSATTVHYEITGGTATLGSDYTIAGVSNNRGTVQVNANATHAFIPLQLTNDGDDELNETVHLRLLRQRNVYDVGSRRDHTVTIRDDDGPVPQARFHSATSTAPEISATRNVRINLSPAPTQPVTLRYTIGGSGVKNTDYRILGTEGRLDVEPGETKAFIRVQTLPDVADDGAKTLVLTLLGGQDGYTLGNRPKHTLTLQDDDVPEVSIALNGGSVHEGQHASFRLTAFPTPGSPITVNVTVEDAPGGDFLQPGVEGTRQITIGSGQKTFTVATHDDSVYEADGSIRVTVTSGGGYDVGSPSSASALVTDNDGRPNPVITISGGSAVTEGRPAEFTLRADPPPQHDLPVKVTIADAASSDFLRDGDEGERTIIIAAESTSKRFTVRTDNDRTDEPDGDVRATVTDGSGYRLGTPSAATVGVRDNDDPPPPPEGPTITITRVSSTIVEGRAAIFTLTADPAPSSPLIVNVQVTQQGDFLRRPAGVYPVPILSDGTGSFLAPTVNDDVEEPEGRIRVRILGGSGYTTGSPSAANVAVHDDDAPPPPPPGKGITVTTESETITEGDAAVFYISADPVPEPYIVSVSYRYEANGGMIIGPRLSHRGDVFREDGVIVVRVLTIDNSRNEADGTATITLLSARGGELGTPITATVTVLDND